MTANIRGLIREAIAAFKAGRKDEAQTLLTRATELDPRNEEAWLWLSAVVDSLENQQICLENVLAINPSNKRAIQGLERIKRQLARNQPSSAASAAPPATPSSDVGHSTPPFELAGTPPSAQSSDPFDMIAGTLPPAAAPAETGGAVHGSGKPVSQPTSDEYDAWVEGLNIGQQDAPAEADSGGSDTFDFSGGPFEQPTAPAVDPFTTGIDYSYQEPEEEAADYGDYVSPGQEGYAEAGYDAYAEPVSGYDEGYVEEAAYVDDDDPFDDVYEAEPGYGDYIEDDQSSVFASSADDAFDPFAGLEADVEAFDQSYEEANDLIKFLDGIPPDIKATYLPGPAAIPRVLRIGMGVVSIGIVVALVVLVLLLVAV